MPVIKSKLNPRSEEFQANSGAMAALVADLRSKIERAAQGGDEAARAKHAARGKLLPRERLDRKSTRLNSSHSKQSRMPSSA